MFLSRTHTHHRECKSSQDFLLSSSTVQARPCSSVSLGVNMSFSGSGKNPHSPCFLSTLIFGWKSVGLGSGISDTDSRKRVPEPYRLLTPRCGLLSRVLRRHWGVVVEKRDICEGVCDIEEVTDARFADPMRPAVSRTTPGLAIVNVPVPALQYVDLGISLVLGAAVAKFRTGS